MMHRKKFQLEIIILSCLVFSLLLSTSMGTVLANNQKSLKVLAIGNSFSQDAMQHIYQIADDVGVEEIVIGNLYIGGSSLEVHWHNARNNLPAYRYDKNTSGVWKSKPNQTILAGLLDEDWDIITVQQVSGYSGVASSLNTHGRLDNLIDYVNEHKTNSEATIAWHMTWAYQHDSNHKNFYLYNSNQLEMYDAIIETTQSEIVGREDIDWIIPAGTAIQNVRTSYIGDILTRDGYHLSNNLGRYIAAMTWVKYFTDLSIDEVTWVPNKVEVPEQYLPIIKEAVNAAVENPFVITQSSFTERPIVQRDDFDYTDYVLFDWEPVGNAYWNSRNSNGLDSTLISYENSTAANLKYFVGSGRMFTREDLPIGTVIEVDQGYNYRPEGWIRLEKHDTREGIVSTPRIIVDEEWWGDYQYRAFNLSHFGNQTDITNRVEETVAAFRIYIPKHAIVESKTSEINKSLKVLAIGNSYSTDSLQHLYGIAQDAGYEEIILANLYIGSSGLELHTKNAKHNLPAYRYDKNDTGTWQSSPSKTMRYGIQDEEWDLITIHERGMYSGTPSEIVKENRLSNLIDYVNEHKLNPDTKVVWHMTWAYEVDSGVATLVNTYDNDQMAMYEAIIHAVETVIVPHPDIDFIIPVGTALQNVRTSYIGDNLTRDGHHLSYNLGRYIAGLTWFHTITGESIDAITWVPSAYEINPHILEVVKEAVQAAVAKPFEISQSTYTERPVVERDDFDYSNYELLDWEPVGNAYWNSRNQAGLDSTLISRENSTAANLKYFIGSKRMFTREDLPIGTIIEIDQGYNYRPEGWINLEYHPTRPGFVTEERVFVTEEWWGDFQYRAFNVSHLGNTTDITKRVDEVASAFRIYVPK